MQPITIFIFFYSSLNTFRVLIGTNMKHLMIHSKEYRQYLPNDSAERADHQASSAGTDQHIALLD